MEFDREPTIAKSRYSIEDEKTLARALGTENSQKEEDSAETRTPELNFQLDMFVCFFFFFLPSDVWFS